MYSGYHQKKQGDATYGYAQSGDALKTSYARGLHGITQHGQGLLNDLGDRNAERLGQNRQFVLDYTPAPKPVVTMPAGFGTPPVPASYWTPDGRKKKRK